MHEHGTTQRGDTPGRNVVLLEGSDRLRAEREPLSKNRMQFMITQGVRDRKTLRVN